MLTLKKFKAKISVSLLIVTMLLSSGVSFASGANSSFALKSGESANTEKAHAEVLISRIHEIASLNKKELNREERSQLKKEVTGIKKELKELGGGVYISATLLVIIIILIILL
jgi:ribosomal protein L11